LVLKNSNNDSGTDEKSIISLVGYVNSLLAKRSDSKLDITALVVNAQKALDQHNLKTH
jgi:hypothetical protein